MARTAHDALGLSDYSRADFMLAADGTPFLLEVNTLPGMTATSLLPQEAQAVGLSFEQLLARLMELGLRKKR
jgi:D-alanine-D-alanine ligase